MLRLATYIEYVQVRTSGDILEFYLRHNSFDANLTSVSL